MKRDTLDTAKAHFSEIDNYTEAGETVEITGNGPLTARLVPANPSASNHKIDIDALRARRDRTLSP